jgi:Protein of unknown function (DUF998)
MSWPHLALFDRDRDGQTTGGRLYARSYLQLRLLIGLSGFLLPVFLIVLDWQFMTEGRQIRGSLSVYYHTPARDLLVAGLCVIGVLLMTYMTAQLWTWDFLLSTAGGIAVVVVAFFPTSRPGLSPTDPRCGEAGAAPPGCTALQQQLGEHVVARVHGTASTVFLLLMSGLCCVFAARAYKFRKTAKEPRIVLYAICATLIILAGLWALFGPDLRLWSYTLHPTYAGEFVAFYAFSVSWFVASWDLIVQILRPTLDRSEPRQAKLSA